MASLQLTTAVKRLRQAAVAGYSYPSEPRTLRDELLRLTAVDGEQAPAIAAIVPHGSYPLSGAVAGAVFGRLTIPARCIILGPNHSGTGHPWSLMPPGAYETPLGEVMIDDDVTAALLDCCPLLASDHRAHLHEHAIEVVLPFLQSRGPANLAIVPMVIGSEDPEELQQLADSLAHVVRQATEPILLIASADFTHDEPQEAVTSKDARLIHAIQAMDAQQFLQEVRVLSVSTCGCGPVACVVSAAHQLGARHAQLVAYGTSAEQGGDPHSSIGYAGLLLS